MKKILRVISARAIYLIFPLALTMFIFVMLKHNDEFKSGNGEIVSMGQRIVARFAFFVIAMGSALIFYKTAKTDFERCKKKGRKVAPK